MNRNSVSIGLWSLAVFSGLVLIVVLTMTMFMSNPTRQVAHSINKSLTDKQVVVVTYSPADTSQCSTKQIDWSSLGDVKHVKLNDKSEYESFLKDNNNNLEPIDSVDSIDNVKCTKDYVFVPSLVDKSTTSAKKVSYPAFLRVEHTNDKAIDRAQSIINDAPRMDMTYLRDLFNVK